VANEGRFVAFVALEDAERTLRVLGSAACVIGHVSAGSKVNLRSAIGADRIVGMLSGEQLPRIC
jgi:hydrogenase expression/formation protein HypE